MVGVYFNQSDEALHILKKTFCFFEAFSFKRDLRLKSKEAYLYIVLLSIPALCMLSAEFFSQRFHPHTVLSAHNKRTESKIQIYC